MLVRIIQWKKSYFINGLTKCCEFCSVLFFTFDLSMKRIHFSTGKKTKMIKPFHLDKVKILILNANDINANDSKEVQSQNSFHRKKK